MSYIKCEKCRRYFVIDDSNPNIHYDPDPSKICSHCQENDKVYPSLNSLNNIIDGLIDESDTNNKYKKYVDSTIQEMHLLYKQIRTLNKYTHQLYFQTLLKNDFISRVNSSTLPEKVKTHLLNYITSYYRNKFK